MSRRQPPRKRLAPNERRGPTPTQSRLLDARSRILESPTADISFHHTVFCQTSLPYRDPGIDVRIWEREQGNVSLRINAGEAKDPDTGKWVDLGLPFGPKARLVLMDLNQTAIKTQSPLIDVGDSMTSYLARRLGLDTNGRNIRALKDQLGRLSASFVRLAICQDERSIQINTNIVSAFDLWFPKDESQHVLWPSTVRLSDDYFKSLVKHAVPLREEAIAALAHNAMALDIYTWLAQRLHRVRNARGDFLPWTALKEQFGQGYSRMDNFKRVFRNTCQQVAAVYPEARADWEGDKGLRLFNSPSPVPPKLIACA